FRAMAGANLTFGLLLVFAAAGFSQIALGTTWLRLLDLAGGVMLLWLAFDGIRGSLSSQQGAQRLPCGCLPSCEVRASCSSILAAGCSSPPSPPPCLPLRGLRAAEP